MERQPNTQYVLSVSYGKDSLACLGAIEKLGWPLDRIVHTEVWATKDIPADLPPMVEFKSKADAIIKERYGIDVEHVCATKTIKSSQNVQVEREREREREREPRRRQIPVCFEDMFYHKTERGKYIGTIKGWPKNTRGQWCKHLKMDGEADIRRFILQSQQREESKVFGENIRLSNETRSMVQFQSQDASVKTNFSNERQASGAKINTVQYLGIAADEPERLARLDGVTKISPLAAVGWTEDDAKQWCIENDLLSPIYTDTCLRGGCWFCHNQGVQQLRELRHNYPDLWTLMLRWDTDSPVSFHADGHTVHDFDRRFQLEDEGVIDTSKTFRWKMIEQEEGEKR